MPRPCRWGECGSPVRSLCGVVPPVQGDPLQERPLDRHRAEDGQDDLDDRVGLEGPVGEQPVEADGDAQGSQDVQAQQQPQFDPAEAPAPEAEDGGPQADKRQDDREEVGRPQTQRKSAVGRLAGR